MIEEWVGSAVSLARDSCAALFTSFSSTWMDMTQQEQVRLTIMEPAGDRMFSAGSKDISAVFKFLSYIKIIRCPCEQSNRAFLSLVSIVANKIILEILSMTINLMSAFWNIIKSNCKYYLLRILVGLIWWWRILCQRCQCINIINKTHSNIAYDTIQTQRAPLSQSFVTKLLYSLVNLGF